MPAAKDETFLGLPAEEHSCFKASPYSLQRLLFDGSGIQQKKMRRLVDSEYKNIRNAIYSTIFLL
jgi:hypothetical protein